MRMPERSTFVGWALRIASLALFLAIWQWYGSDPLHFSTPPPTKVFPALWDAVANGDLPRATLGTLLTVATGMIISIAIGVPLGFAIALFPWARNTLDPLIDAVYAMPVTMLI